MSSPREEIIGDCRLILGDCRDILPALGPVDHIITDPPYGCRTHARHDASSERRRDGSDARALGYSALTEGEAVDLAELLAKTSAGWVVWFTDSDLAGPIRDAMDGQGRTTFAPLPYHHPGRSVRLAGDGPSSWTDWIVVSRTVALKRWGTLPGGYVAGPGWNDKERMGGKPVVLMDLVVGDYSRQRETICDPFMGAGTTGVACARSNRQFIGIEIDGPSFATACRRIEEAYKQPRLFSEPVAKPIQPSLLDDAA